MCMSLCVCTNTGGATYLLAKVGHTSLPSGSTPYISRPLIYTCNNNFSLSTVYLRANRGLHNLILRF